MYSEYVVMLVLLTRDVFVIDVFTCSSDVTSVTSVLTFSFFLSTIPHLNFNLLLI
jgi:hypothetical protein